MVAAENHGARIVLSDGSDQSHVHGNGTRSDGARHQAGIQDGAGLQSLRHRSRVAVLPGSRETPDDLRPGQTHPYDYDYDL